MRFCNLQFKVKKPMDRIMYHLFASLGFASRYDGPALFDASTFVGALYRTFDGISVDVLPVESSCRDRAPKSSRQECGQLHCLRLELGRTGPSRASTEILHLYLGQLGCRRSREIRWKMGLASFAPVMVVPVSARAKFEPRSPGDHVVVLHSYRLLPDGQKPRWGQVRSSLAGDS